MATIATLRHEGRIIVLHDEINPNRSGRSLVPYEGKKVTFIGEEKNKVGLSGSYCGKDHGYYPWVIVNIDGNEMTISSFYLTK